jgi:sulfane dehydrogenase subunit SoxC
MKSTRQSRRGFLKEGGAALVGLTAAGAHPASAQDHAHAPQSAGGAASDGGAPARSRPYGERSRFVTTARVPESAEPEPLNQFIGLLTPLQDSTGIITPNPLHFATSHGYHPPDLDPAEHRLMVHGMVERPVIFTMEELRQFPVESHIYFLECSANGRSMGPRRKETVAETHGRTACAEWTGVPLRLLLERAGVQPGASWVLAEGAEAGKHLKSVPLAKCVADCLVAFAQNGEPVRPENGYPLRLIVPGFEAIYSVKWLRRLKVVEQPYVAFEEISRYVGYDDPRVPGLNFEMGPKSVITYPSSGHFLPRPGTYQISGLAWSGCGAITRVEVSTDGGLTWRDARIESPAHRMAHTRFGFSWTWNGEDARLQSRCTDELGQVQPSVAQYARFWDFSVEQVKNGANGFGHVNFIHTWAVAKDGTVRNAVFG